MEEEKVVFYVDSDFRIHLSEAPGFERVEAPINLETAPFYRFIPEGRSWKRDDGVIFSGPMLAPAIDTESVDYLIESYTKAYQKGVNSI